jgi:hypothetical protein
MRVVHLDHLTPYQGAARDEHTRREWWLWLAMKKKNNNRNSKKEQ